MINVHELANTTGYGKATKAVKKAGLWDEYAGLDEREFSVWITATVTVEDTNKVTARHRDEAEEIAIKEFMKDHDCDEDDIDDLSVKELEAKR